MMRPFYVVFYLGSLFILPHTLTHTHFLPGYFHSSLGPFSFFSSVMVLSACRQLFFHCEISPALLVSERYRNGKWKSKFERKWEREAEVGRGSYDNTDNSTTLVIFFLFPLLPFFISSSDSLLLVDFGSLWRKGWTLCAVVSVSWPWDFYMWFLFFVEYIAVCFSFPFAVYNTTRFFFWSVRNVCLCVSLKLSCKGLKAMQHNTICNMNTIF